MGFDGSVGSAVEAQKWTSKIPLTEDINGMNDCEEKKGGGGCTLSHTWEIYASLWV